MTTDELVAETNRLGITLTCNGEKLRVEAPTGALTDELRQALGEHKTEILALLTRSYQAVEALLGRLRTGQTWLLDQHRRWQAGDTDATDDEAFSKAWGWLVGIGSALTGGTRSCRVYPRPRWDLS